LILTVQLGIPLESSIYPLTLSEAIPSTSTNLSSYTTPPYFQYHTRNTIIYTSQSPYYHQPTSHPTPTHPIRVHIPQPSMNQVDVYSPSRSFLSLQMFITELTHRPSRKHYIAIMNLSNPISNRPHSTEISLNSLISHNELPLHNTTHITVPFHSIHTKINNPTNLLPDPNRDPLNLYTLHNF
jgi:hypothetical protein